MRRTLALASALFASIATGPFGGGPPSPPIQGVGADGEIVIDGEETIVFPVTVRIPAATVEDVTASSVSLIMRVDAEDFYAFNARFGGGIGAVVATGTAESIWTSPDVHLDCEITGSWCTAVYDLRIEVLGDYQATVLWWVDAEVEGADVELLLP